MTPQEANKICAEYMGRVFESEFDDIVMKDKYVSLDALVPVWEKLNKRVEIKNYYGSDDEMAWTIDIDYSTQKGTIQSAACMATARAIKELESDTNKT